MSKGVAAGLLDKRVKLQTSATGQDAIGEPNTGWTDFATVWAGIRDISGREYMAAAAVQNSAQTRIFIRALAGVVPSMRVLHGTVAYNIEAVLEQENGSLLLICSRLS